MRKVLVVLVTALMLAFPARADAISVSPLEALAENTWRWLPWVLVAMAVIVTAVAVRKNGSEVDGMKRKISGVLLAVLAAMSLSVNAWGDVISPGEALVQSGILPVVLVIAVVIVTAVIVRKKRKK